VFSLLWELILNVQHWLDDDEKGPQDKYEAVIVAFHPTLRHFRGVFLIADLDSPRGGVIWVHPQNLLAVSQSMKP
jgi:hypothetical protein